MKKFVALASLLVMGFASPVVQADGAAVYNSGCMACHNSGVAGSPKIGDKDAWADRIAQGMDLLYEHAIVGFRARPATCRPKGDSPT